MYYRPEGSLIKSAENAMYIANYERLREAMDKEIILEARVAVCSSSHDLIVDLPCGKGIIPRNEGAIGISEGKTRDIALISRVNKPVCFIVTDVRKNDSGTVSAVLSRKKVQEKCLAEYIENLRSGDIIDARVTHLEQFGCFVDVGCGISSMIPIDMISVSRISHPEDRFKVGQYIKAVVKSKENSRILLTHKELLGTWEENASVYSAGETVAGTVRSIEEYGIFVELAPNLAGLAELRDNVMPGQQVSVYIKAIIPEKMKIKLVIVDTCESMDEQQEMKYFISCGHIEKWNYASAASGRELLTEFN